MELYLRDDAAPAPVDPGIFLLLDPHLVALGERRVRGVVREGSAHSAHEEMEIVRRRRALAIERAHVSDPHARVVARIARRAFETPQLVIRHKLLHPNRARGVMTHTTRCE